MAVRFGEMESGVRAAVPDILTPLQREVLTKIFNQSWIRERFYLTGGTALSAYYLHHRYSDDLDFFTHQADLEPVAGVMRSVCEEGGWRLTAEGSSPTFRRFLVERHLRVDFVSDVEFRVGAPVLKEGHMVDAVKNIAVNKVTAIFGRLDVKDYVDLYMLLEREPWDLWELLALARQKDGGLEPFRWAGVLADVETFTVLPRMIVPLTLDQLKHRVREWRAQIVDRLKP